MSEEKEYIPSWKIADNTLDYIIKQITQRDQECRGDELLEVLRWFIDQISEYMIDNSDYHNLSILNEHIKCSSAKFDKDISLFLLERPGCHQKEK